MKRKHIFIVIAALTAALFGLGAVIFFKKSPAPTSTEIAKSLYTVEDVHNVKSGFNTIVLVCEEGYFPDYVKGRVMKDEYGTLLIDYTNATVSADDELERLRSDSRIIYAEFTGTPNVFIEDTSIGSTEIADSANRHLSYAHSQFNSDAFIEDTSFDGLIRIGVIDTGVQYDHPYLIEHINKELSYDFVNGRNDVYDDGSFDVHATAVDSNIIDVLAGGKKALSFEIVNHKALQNGQGTGYDISRAIYRAANDGCNIVNCSFGSRNIDTLIANAIDYAVSKGVIVVCAAGNDFGSALNYPAALENTISVGSINEDRLISEFSNINAEYVAAGSDILSANVGNQFKFFHGTSMASPNLVGFIAILYANGYTDLASIRSKLTEMSIDLGAPGKDDIYGNGLPAYTKKETPVETPIETSSAEESPSEETVPFETESSAVQPPEKETTPAPTDPTETTPVPTPVPTDPTETTPFETEPTAPAPVQPPTTSPEVPSKPIPETSTGETIPVPTETAPLETETEPTSPVQPAYPVGISIAVEPDKTEYWIGDCFYSEGLKLNLLYSDGSKTIVSSGFHVLEPDMHSSGRKNVTVLYKNFYTGFDIKINAPTIVISGGNCGGMSTSFTATTYPSGGKITWKSDDSNVFSVSSDGKVTAKSAGSANVTASFTFNGHIYSAKKNIKVSYSKYSNWSDFRFAREDTSNLKEECVFTGYFWYYFACPVCNYHSAFWNVMCPYCHTYIPFDGVCEIFSATQYSIAGNAAYGAAYLSGESLLRNATGGYYMATLNNSLAYVHNSLSTQPVYRYRTRSLIIEKIK